MRLWESTDGGASFHRERDIANIAGGFEGPPRIAVADDGGGWVTWRDEHGLQAADLNVPAPPVVPPVVKTPSPPPPPANITASVSIEGTSLTLSTPTNASNRASCRAAWRSNTPRTSARGGSW